MKLILLRSARYEPHYVRTLKSGGTPAILRYGHGAETETLGLGADYLYSSKCDFGSWARIQISFASMTALAEMLHLL